ncbi:MAG: glycosyltransferase family 2 protein [Pseudomonadota bacterium]
MTDAVAANVCAVVVTYRPDADALGRLLAAVIPQVGSVVVVDNGDPAWRAGMSEATAGAIQMQSMPTNVGLAAAQNAGIAWAREHGYRYVLILDQDSTPGPAMVDRLLAVIASPPDGSRLAAVGPVFEDEFGDGRAPFVRIGFPLNRKLWCTRPDAVLACDFLISSGSLIPLEVIDVLGPMNEGLFIDNVDLEWCFRAAARGYRLYGVCAASMRHRLGDARRPLPLGLGSVVVHGPVRLYYMMRNRLRLYRMPHTPWIWIAQDLPRLLVKLALFSVLVGPRLRNLRFMLRGIRDGVRGREGPCPIP